MGLADPEVHAPFHELTRDRFEKSSRFLSRTDWIPIVWRASEGKGHV